MRTLAPILSLAPLVALFGLLTFRAVPAGPNAKIVIIGAGKEGLPLILGGDAFAHGAPRR
jgi:hypothetical protein